MLSYNDFGPTDGFPVLVQHGSIASVRDTGLFAGLAGEMRVIAIARPGYGESSPYQLRDVLEYGEIVATLVSALGLGHFGVLSCSSGAPYGYAIAGTCPDRVQGVYVYSGTPALYDEAVRAGWPFPVTTGLTVAESQRLAYEVFFANMEESDRSSADVVDSMAHGCFGEAQNLRIRFEDWGFQIGEIAAPVFMQHSKVDEVIPYGLAVRTAELLPYCELELLEDGSHFSADGLDSFIRTTVVRQIESTLR